MRFDEAEVKLNKLVLESEKSEGTQSIRQIIKLQYAKILMDIELKKFY